MIKKAILTAAIVGGGAVAFLGADACSYSKAIYNNAREAVRSEIDPNLQLDNIREQVGDLMPEIREHMKVVATQVVDVRNLEEDISRKQHKLSSQKAAILALRSDLDSNEHEFEYRHVSYTRNEVESDLADRFDSYQTLEQSVQRDRKILTAQQKVLKANQVRLDSMMSRKQELGVKVAELEAKLKEVEANEATYAVREVDDTHLSHVEDLLQQLSHDLDVRQAHLEMEGHVAGQIPVEEEADPPAADVISAIDDHFGINAPSAELVSSADSL